jgi:hypothetical protein
MDNNIQRAVREVIQKCGKYCDPVEYALFRVGKSTAKGDMAGAKYWLNIVKAIKDRRKY